MSNILGNAWWAERNRTNKRYLASRHLLEKAASKNAESASIKPYEVKEPARLSRSLTYLKLKKTDL
ncbi:MAG: J domain-containing protein, partial [Desulfobacterales bacterium]